jgi:uncharacterized protein YciI
MFFLPLFLTAQQINPAYDSTLAESLGADDYGMKSYTFVILKTGQAEIDNKSVRDSLFRGHFANMNRLADEGKLIIAGPLGANENSYRGIFIFNATSPEEINNMLQVDPTIREGIFEAEIYPWYGSAALPMYLEFHKKIEKIKIE